MLMEMLTDVSLSDYSTMKLGGNAKYLVTVKSESELDEAIEFAKSKSLNVIMIGGGSNIFWKDSGFDGLVIINEIGGFEIKNNGDEFELTVGAGENWDEVVRKVCELNLSGIEALSLIPGSVGGTPVQNAGAYGQEIASTFKSLRAYDNNESKYVMLSKEDCRFFYRNSRFKSEPNRFFITSITLILKKETMKPPFYASLTKYLEEHHIDDYSPGSIRKAVIDIRRSKLPDPAVVKNCGSFFANPIIPNDQVTEIESKYPDVPIWSVSKGMSKVSAAWLIDQVGFKNYKDSETGIATWPKQSLILINESAKSTEDLLAFKQKIVTRVKEKFNIELVQEPILLP